MMIDQTVQSPVSLSMTTYAGQWTVSEASHLLRRTMFGPTFQQIQACVSNGMSASVTSLLTIPTINPPIATSSDETIAPLGTTWVNSVYPSGDTQPIENARVYSLAAWTMKKINEENFSIAEKICLFWQNHFAAELAFDSRATFNYHQLIRTYALGDFKEFIKKMTIDPTMLIFLNGVSNQFFSPNENYARELLELYTIGKGPLVSTGDYTNYKEEDIAQSAKILTGWTINGLRSTTITKPVAVFNPAYHDNTTKTLSSRFGGAVINAAGSSEYENYIDVIFQQAEVANFICKKIYRFFVNYEITADVEANVIPVLAQTFIQNNFNVLPVMQQLLTSEHFYDVALRGTIIKNPLEVLFSMLNTSQSLPTYDIVTNQKMYITLYSYAQTLGLSYLSPPNVGGWSAYYQAPSYSRLWINSTFLKQRFQVGAYLSILSGIPVGTNHFKINALQLVDGLSNPSSAQDVIDDLCIVFFPKSIDTTTKTTLKAVLLNGLQDFEWSIQYSDYLSDKNNINLSTPIRTRTEALLYQIFQLPEFQTI